jgi:thiosulfate reductase cytochrome b subunit
MRRSILRWVHLLLSIPLLGYIYGEPAEVQQYASGVRYLFFPVILLSGLRMYSGVVFAVIGVAVWLGAYRLSGFGPALGDMIVLFLARKLWLVIRARR